MIGLPRRPATPLVAPLVLALAATLALGPVTGREVPAGATRDVAVASSAPSGPVAAAAPGDAETRFSAGGQGTCKVRPNGEARCAGDNFAGQVGDGTTTPRIQLTAVRGGSDWSKISSSGGNACAIKKNDSLWCWGQNTRGQLGIGNQPQQHTPQRVGKDTWRKVATGWLSTCGIRTNGSLWCWGSNKYGGLGIGNLVDHRRPVQVGEAKNWKSVTVGGWHACGLRTDGGAVCWGLNDFGQLGNGSTTRRSKPVRVATDARLSSIDASWSSTCAVTEGDDALCWGINDQGQLGDGSRTRRTLPTAVSGSQSWATVATGDGHSCGLDTRGLAWCWGSNRYGQLGDGSKTSSTTPVRVAGAIVWRGLDTGWMHSCGYSPDNEVLCWGNNEQGQLARGNRTNKLTPPGVDVPRRREAQQAPDDVMTSMSMNVLDSVHTGPGGGALTYAPGRIRAEWAANVVRDDRADVVGFQELSTGQAARLRPAIKDAYDVYPKAGAPWKEVLVSVAWKKAEWSLVKADLVRAPYLGWVRPIPMVLLRNKATGRSFWFMNTHNSPGPSTKAQAERDRAVRIQIDKIRSKRKQGVPVIFLGDMNERERVFCKVVGQTDLKAVQGGSVSSKACRPPSFIALDWMFLSPEFTVRSHVYERSARTSRITDHAVLSARMTIPGS